MSDVDLVDFLRARLDEDEQLARTAGGQPTVEPYPDHADEPDGMWWVHDHQDFQVEAIEATVRHVARHDPARALADVAAKRQLIKVIQNYESAIDHEWDYRGRPETESALRVLALPYAGHPDYRTEWAV